MFCSSYLGYGIIMFSFQRTSFSGGFDCDSGAACFGREGHIHRSLLPRKTIDQICSTVKTALKLWCFSMLKSIHLRSCSNLSSLSPLALLSASKDWANDESGLHRLLASRILASHGRTLKTRPSTRHHSCLQT